jgi:hypothetical protein
VAAASGRRTRKASAKALALLVDEVAQPEEHKRRRTDKSSDTHAQDVQEEASLGGTEEVGPVLWHETLVLFSRSLPAACRTAAGRVFPCMAAVVWPGTHWALLLIATFHNLACVAMLLQAVSGEGDGAVAGDGGTSSDLNSKQPAPDLDNSKANPDGTRSTGNQAVLPPDAASSSVASA